jgi:hypothetical protein
MIICGYYMFEFSVSEGMRKKNNNKGGGSREDSNTFMSNIDYQRIES